VTADAADAFVALVASTVVLAPDAAAQPGISPDPGDDYLVALALDRRVDAVVTGDRALRSVRIEGLVILTPVEALAALDDAYQPNAGA
jgi:predicted nucleic acid-binding protein